MKNRSPAESRALQLLDEVQRAIPYVVESTTKTANGLELRLAHFQSDPKTFTARLIHVPEAGPHQFRVETDLPPSHKPIGIWHSFKPIDGRSPAELSIEIPASLAVQLPLPGATIRGDQLSLSVSLDDLEDLLPNGPRFAASLETPDDGSPTIYFDVPLLPDTDSDVVAVELRYKNIEGQNAYHTKLVMVERTTPGGVAKGSYTFDEFPADAPEQTAKVIIRPARIEEVTEENLKRLLERQSFEASVVHNSFPLDIKNIQSGKTYIAVDPLAEYREILAPMQARKISISAEVGNVAKKKKKGERTEAEQKSVNDAKEQKKARNRELNEMANSAEFKPLFDSAFTNYVHEHAPRIRRRLRKHLPESAVDDVTQEFLLRASKHLGEIPLTADEIGQIRFDLQGLSFLNVILDNMRTDAQRKMGRHNNHEKQVETIPDVAQNDDPSLAVFLDEHRQFVRAHLCDLSVERQAVMTLYLQGLTTEEISLELGRPIRTVSDQVKKSIEQLRQIFAKSEQA